MRLHTDFHALKKSAAWIAEVLNDEDINDGAFSRVGLESHHQALKATRCSATNLLFEQLLRRRNRGLSVPECLPAVFKRHGDLVRDSEGLVYTVWTVERLFRPDDEVQMRLARATSRAAYRQLKPGYLQKVSRQQSLGCDALRQVLQQEQGYCRCPTTWQGSADIALTMSLRTEGELKNTFRFLLEFVERHQLALDLLTQGNILLNMFGEPCLSDPVCVDESGEQAEPVSVGICVACLVPTGMRGITDLVFEPISSLALDEAERGKMVAALRKLGLEPRLMEWGSAEHKAFLAQPAQSRGLWSVPQAAQHLRSRHYEQLFTN